MLHADMRDIALAVVIISENAFILVGQTGGEDIFLLHTPVDIIAEQGGLPARQQRFDESVELAAGLYGKAVA